jgi:hypothetical protein
VPEIYRWIFYALLFFGTLILAASRGRTPERLVALTIALDVGLSMLAATPFQVRFLRMEIGVMLADACAFVALAAIAKLAGRQWVVWIAGLKLFQVLSHLPIVLQPEVSPTAYYSIQAALSYPELIILLVVTIRGMKKTAGAKTAEAGIAGSPAPD